MATIQNSIAITDGVTAPLQRMAKAAEVTTGRFEAASAAANKIETSVSGSTSQKVEAVASAARSLEPAFGAASVAAESTAGSVGMIGTASAAARAGIVSLGVTIATVYGGFLALMGLIMAAFHSISGSFRLSDELSQTTARLNLMNDGLQTTAQLQAMIFASAQRSRSEYQATADFVAKIGMMAGKIFTSNSELIGVAETINKIFKISGTNAQEQASATLQLTQALASGVLRGEELNAVFEAAPMMIRKIADYLGVDIGKIREMAQEGQLTAGIVKNAMIAAAGEINQTFETIPKTWGDIWTSFQNTAVRGLQPLFEEISLLANNSGVQTFVNRIATGIAYTGAILVGAIHMIERLASVVSNVLGYAFGWASAIATIAFQGITAAVPVVIGAILGLAAAWAILNYQVFANAALEAIAAARHAITTAWMWLQTAAVWASSSAKAAWAAITMGVVSAQMFLAFAIALVTGNLYIIAAVIVGVMVAALAVWGLASINLRDAFAGAMDFMIDACETGVNMMARMINGLVDIINKAATGLNALFGTNIGSVDHVGTVDFQGAKKWSGYLREGTFMDHLTGEIKGLFQLPEMPGANDYVPEIASAGAATADNTKKIKDAMEITDEDIKYMRDIAEQEVINRYTTAEVKIEMGGIHNSVSSDMDLDGVVRYINDNLFEAMVSGAEAVHP
ncbi:MAG TPA: tape measure protein [Selenomonadales bacterium]|nr:tape measure protein [Selenomonadales bacterium]